MKKPTSDATLVVPTFTCSSVCAAAVAAAANAGMSASEGSARRIGPPGVGGYASFGDARRMSTIPPAGNACEIAAASRHRGFAPARRLPEDAAAEQGTAMQPAPDLATIPGRRIGHYRNSARRRIKLYGLGQTGAAVARAVGVRGLANVEVRSGTGAAGWAEVTGGGATDRDTNMIGIVGGGGDEDLFRPEPERPQSLVTFVLLQRQGNLLVGRPRSVSGARGSADLFVTTSDRDYVADLIDNLAS